MRKVEGKGEGGDGILGILDLRRNRETERKGEEVRQKEGWEER